MMKPMPALDLPVLPKIFALLVALPLLTVFADVLGVFGGMSVARAASITSFRSGSSLVWNRPAMIWSIAACFASAHAEVCAPGHPARLYASAQNSCGRWKKMQA